jgi:hypothetical protein
MSSNIKQLLERTRSLDVTARQGTQGEFRGSGGGEPSPDFVSGVGRELFVTRSSDLSVGLVVWRRDAGLCGGQIGSNGSKFCTVRVINGV